MPSSSCGYRKSIRVNLRGLSGRTTANRSPRLHRRKSENAKRKSVTKTCAMLYGPPMRDAFPLSNDYANIFEDASGINTQAESFRVRENRFRSWIGYFAKRFVDNRCCRINKLFLQSRVHTET